MAKILTCPSEAGDIFRSGWYYRTGAGSTTANYLTTGIPTIETGGSTYGGDYVLRSGTSAAILDMFSPRLTQGVREVYVKIRLKRGEAGTVWTFKGIDNDEVALLQIHWQGGNILVYASGVLIITATALGTPTLNVWYLCELRMNIDATTGTAELLVDGVSQGTYGPAAIGVGDGDGIIGWQIGPSNQTAYYDDIEANSITLRYKGVTAGAAPAAGEILTGGDSGATVRVTATLESDATTGTVLCEQWNNTAFVNDEALTSDGTLVAEVDAPNDTFVDGFEPNSSWLGDAVVMRVDMSGDGAQSELLNSAGTSVANWSYVTPGSGSATYVEALVVGERDTYANNGLSVLPGAGDCVVDSASVHLYGECTLNGIAGAQTVMRYSGTDYDGARLDLPTERYGVSYIYNTRPDDNETAWDAGTVGNSEAGQAFVA